MDGFEVVHVPDHSRYELLKDGQVIGYATARVDGERIVMPHVEVTPQYENQGLGSRLVRFALDDVRARGAKVVPICPFVKAIIRRYPEYGGLVA